MPNGQDERPAANTDRPPSRYTCFFLELSGHWSKAHFIFALDDVEALRIAIIMAEGKQFELLEGLRLVHWPTEDLN